MLTSYESYTNYLSHENNEDIYNRRKIGTFRVLALQDVYLVKVNEETFSNILELNDSEDSEDQLYSSSKSRFMDIQI